MRSKGKQARSRHTIQTILTGAAQLLIELGYSRATTNKIAERSGFSVGTLYQYFEGKEDIYLELMAHECGKIVVAVEQSTAHETLRDTLTNMYSRVFQSQDNNPKLVQALSHLLDGPFLEIRNNARDEALAAVARLLEAHRDEITVPDLQLAALTIVSANEGFIVNANTSAYTAADLLQQGLRLQLAYLTMPDYT
ncbi:MAG: TetR/AcrR family transcriptional regulator [Halioglobus sp.]|nr:TetR/AcrR family transcriptional regulator [Halioglobus sp.]